MCNRDNYNYLILRYGLQVILFKVKVKVGLLTNNPAETDKQTATDSGTIILRQMTLLKTWEYFMSLYTDKGQLRFASTLFLGPRVLSLTRLHCLT